MKEERMQEGTVVKAVGGFFFVDTPAGEYRCYLRGRIKRDLVILVGDRVKIRPVDRENAVIEAVLPRRNSLIRPPSPTSTSVSSLPPWLIPP